ncbi:fibropellin-1 isoform X9 [Parasteatoda tepidariorum]|uniref:fibropellin-1 isoform X9 n=1 Tax=Parasteatoda tepidariorum TaxID=114398 RepID=UPI0039BCFCD2
MNKCVISFLLICVAYVADSLSIDSTFNGDGYECKGTECIGENQKCVPKGNDYYCDCNVNFKLVDEEKKGAKDVQCKDTFECTCTECIGENQKCVPKGNDYYCDCNENFKLVDDKKKGTKEIQCKDKYECGGTECTGENQRCIPKGNDYFCDCQKDFKLVDETLKGIKDIECRDKYECLGTECTGENQICIPKGNDYFCDCQKDFKLVDEGKKGTKVIQCKDFDTTPGELSTRFNYLTSTPGELPTRFKYLTSTRGELSTRFNYLTSTPGELSTSLKYLTSTPGELSTRFKYLTSTRGEFSTRSKSICDEDRNDCVNGAECLQLGNQRFCHCLKGTYGDKCQHMWDCDERYNLKCNYKNGEICAYNTTLEESECLCVESELQYDTEQGKCKKTCVVGNHDCENGAICKTVGNYGFCECRLGTTGHKCERVTDCDFMNCTNTTGGRCDYDRRLEIAKCVCDNGLKYDEYAYECREICNPQKNDCQNGAMCEKEGNYSFCRCIPRSYGHKCEIVDDCESQKVICNENSGARCGINMDFRGAECLCDNGLKYDEESLTCRETCNFYKNKCENGAHCNRIGAYLFCDCPPGYFGHRCEEVTDKGEYSPLLFILLCITSGFLLISTITLVIIFIKFRSRRNK